MPYQTVDNIIAGTEVGYEQFQQIRDGIRAAVFSRQPIGGSRLFAVMGTGAQDAHNAIPVSVPNAESSGAVYKVEAWTKCADAATTITPRIRNITDSTNAVLGVAADGTEWESQTLAFTPVVGKEYRLQFTKSDDDHPCWGFGILQRTDN